LVVGAAPCLHSTRGTCQLSHPKMDHLHVVLSTLGLINAHGDYTLRMVSVVAFVAASLGRWIAQYQDGVLNQPVKTEHPQTPIDVDSDSSSDSNQDDSDSSSDEEQKLILVVRTDLKMSKSKVCTQCSKAAIAACQSWIETNPEAATIYERRGQPKVTLKAKDEEELYVVSLSRVCGSSLSYVWKVA
jgi:hypothetical protein